jgi:hypothetical protein
MGSSWRIVALSLPTTTIGEDIFEVVNDIANNKVEWTRHVGNNPVYTLEMACSRKFIF